MGPASESFQPASNASAEDESRFPKWLRSLFSTKRDVGSNHSSTAVTSIDLQAGACLQEAPFAHGGTDAVTIDWVVEVGTPSFRGDANPASFCWDLSFKVADRSTDACELACGRTAVQRPMGLNYPRPDLSILVELRRNMLSTTSFASFLTEISADNAYQDALVEHISKLCVSRLKDAQDRKQLRKFFVSPGPRNGTR
jgi:hypothetical protein